MNLDCQVLQQLRGATAQDPFRFVALKWYVKAHSSGLNAVVAPRDMVVVQSSGIVPDSPKIGFHLLHSVEIPEYASLEDRLSILRCRISSAFIFRQLAHELVEVYVANYVEPNGSAPEPVIVSSAAGAMSGSWRAVGCSQTMKLAWILKNKEAYLGRTGAGSVTGSVAGSVAGSATRSSKSLGGDTSSSCFVVCHGKATLAGKIVSCVLCDLRVCSRCRVSQKLSQINRRSELVSTKYAFCKPCFIKCVNDDALRIASELYTGAAITPWGNRTTSISTATSTSGTMGKSSSSSIETRTKHSHSKGSTASMASAWSSHHGENGRDTMDSETSSVQSVVLEPMAQEEQAQEKDEWVQANKHFATNKGIRTAVNAPPYRRKNSATSVLDTAQATASGDDECQALQPARVLASPRADAGASSRGKQKLRLGQGHGLTHIEVVLPCSLHEPI